jgi:hypothetical protein
MICSSTAVSGRAAAVIDYLRVHRQRSVSNIVQRHVATGGGIVGRDWRIANDLGSAMVEPGNRRRTLYHALLGCGFGGTFTAKLD